MALPSLIKRSIPKISAMAATGIFPTSGSVEASTINPEPVTPAAPFDVINNIQSNDSCCVKLIGVFVACAKNIAAIVR